jgi:hypothetical protein
LEISTLGPLPVLAGQLFTVIGRSIHFTLQKHKLPKAAFCPIAFSSFHIVFSPFFRKGLSATLMPLENSATFGMSWGNMARRGGVKGAMCWILNTSPEKANHDTSLSGIGSVDFLTICSCAFT